MTTDVFISYSRHNEDFVRKLFNALLDEGRDNKDIWVDWEDIPLTADWWEEIQRGIEGADTFVFVISPDSLQSPIVHMEINHARQYGKRIVPVVHQDAEVETALGALAARKLDDLTLDRLAGRDIMQMVRDNWQVLSRHNWLFFREEDDFDTAFNDLLGAIAVDLQHVR
ncbi:MAG: toll/interleukin-1 receptor domain-containing protein, partial [Chloroflexi bacterium]